MAQTATAMTAAASRRSATGLVLNASQSAAVAATTAMTMEATTSKNDQLM